ncbi:MAG: hypothetical protein ACLUSP_06465 [Christensenellales bacterium]
MKKFIGVLLSLVTALSALSLSGCGNNPGGDDPTIPIDPNKTQIVFNFYNGGHGSEWVTNAAIEWNKTNDKYQIVTAPDKEEWYSIKAKLESGTCSYDIMHNTPLESEYARGYLEDLTDVWNATAKGEDVTISSKFKNPEAAENAFGYNGGHFAIPCFDTFSGFVYDHELFRENLFLIGTDGELIKKSTDKLGAGRDGIEGTIDDGQPVNMTQYVKMVNAIKSSDFMTYLWTGKFGYYLDPMFWSIFFDYEGESNARTFMRRSGEYTNRATGANRDFADNATEIFNMGGIRKRLISSTTISAIRRFTTRTPQSTEQAIPTRKKSFVYGNAFDGAGSYKQVAFLYEGNWWEREAGQTSTRSKIAEWTNTSTVRAIIGLCFRPRWTKTPSATSLPLVGFSTEPICVKKQTDPEKRAAIVDFLRFFYSTSQIKKTMSDSNGCMPFNVILDDEEKKSFTRFTLNAYELYYSENSYLVPLKYVTSGYKVPKFVTTDANDVDSISAQPVSHMLRGAGITTKGDSDKVFADTVKYYDSHRSKLIG